MSREVLISGNWKMNHNHFQAIEAVQKLAALLRANPVPEGREVSLHPPFTSLRSVQTAVESDKIPVSLGAQTCHEADRGAFTGEISADFLAKMNVRYVIAGHSERRQFCGETDDMVRHKLDAIWRHSMVPILCVGETLFERESGSAEEKVRAQLETAMLGRRRDLISGMVVAYEPIWAIGTGRNATPDDAQKMCSLIRQAVATIFSDHTAEAMRIQYGGSVTPENAHELLEADDVDGLLVGGASLDASDFAAIIGA